MSLCTQFTDDIVAYLLVIHCSKGLYSVSQKRPTHDVIVNFIKS